MKKNIVKFLFVLMALITAVVTAAGCTFIAKNNTFPSANTDKDSVIAAQGVEFVTEDANKRVKLDMEEAVEKVERTAVALQVDGGAGSGVIVDVKFEGDDVSWKKDDNIIYIITCHHMVSDTENITVMIPDENCSYSNEDYIFEGKIGSETPSYYESQGYAVTLVGGDMESDIAIIKINLAKKAKSGNILSKDKIVMATIPSEESGYKVKKGETVFSVGNPTGTLPGTVSGGVVSYLERETSVNEVGNMTLMQIDVSTNPGNSGGGLYNLYGELIGITNAGNTNYEGINFAIPCYLSTNNGFVEIAEQLGGTASENNYGYVTGRKVKFGFTVNEQADTDTTYIVVAAVTEKSLAANSGMQEGDIIEKISVNEGEAVAVYTVKEFSAILGGLKVGDRIKITVQRQVRRGFRIVYESVDLNTMVTAAFHFCNTGK